MGSRIVVCLFLEVNWNTLLKHVLKASDSTQETLKSRTGRRILLLFPGAFCKYLGGCVWVKTWAFLNTLWSSPTPTWNHKAVFMTIQSFLQWLKSCQQKRIILKLGNKQLKKLFNHIEQVPMPIFKVTKPKQCKYGKCYVLGSPNWPSSDWFPHFMGRCLQFTPI